jgi:hypothetical protein
MTAQAYDYGDQTKSEMGLGRQKKPVSLPRVIEDAALIRQIASR